MEGETRRRWRERGKRLSSHLITTPPWDPAEKTDHHHCMTGRRLHKRSAGTTKQQNPADPGKCRCLNKGPEWSDTYNNGV